MSKNSSKTIICLWCLIFTGWQQITFGQNSWREKIATATAWGSNNKELIELIGCLTQIPGILATDCDKPLAVKSAALLNLTVTDAKILKELLAENNGCLAKQCIYNIPKTIAYLIANRYDQLRLTSPQKKLIAESPEAKKLLSFKITQFFQLGIEALFRVFAYIDALDTTKTERNHLSKQLSEAADWVELWRLLSRLSLLEDQEKTVKPL